MKINRAIADGSIFKNPEIISAFSYAKERRVPLHLMEPLPQAVFILRSTTPMPYAT